MEEFRSQFSANKIGKGTEIYIKNEDSTLITWINGKETKRIINKILCCSLFDVYLGNNPISVKAKEVRGKFKFCLKLFYLFYFHSYMQ